MNNTVKEWKDYEDCLKYNDAIIGGDKSYNEQIDVNIAFTQGDQWRNVQADDISKPVIPVIQKAREHTIANVCSTNISATIHPLEYTTNEEERTPEMTEEIKTTDMANAEIRNIFDNIKFEFKVREGLGDAFDMGDMCLHFYWDAFAKPYKGKYGKYKGKLCGELKDAPNVLFGNSNNPNPQIQPFIILSGREIASVLKEEASQYKKKIEDNDVNNITRDYDYDDQAGDNGKVELDNDEYGKALYIIYYKRNKKTGHILATKAVKSAYIYKDVDTGLSLYPVAWMNYKKQKNQYHGRAGATGLIPNQIAINKLLAMVIYNVMKTAFPTLIYNAKRMSAPTNEIGKAIPMNLENGESVNNMATYLQTGQISSQVMSLIDAIIEYTKDMLGINDAAVGNVNPDNAQAIALAEKLTSVPLENLRSNLYEFTEQVVDIILDFVGTKYGTRPVKIKNGDNVSLIEYDFTKLKDLNTSKRIDVGAIGYASELTSLKELKDLLNGGFINAVEYIERLPEYTIPEVKTLVDDIKMRMGITSAKEQQEKEKQWEVMAQFFKTLPLEEQNRLNLMTDDEKEKAVMEMMKQGGQTNEIPS